MKMTLNLPILSLDIVDSLSFQKCLMPRKKFPSSTRPGHWAKCYFTELSSGKQFYTVVQLFPREDLDAMCYLDTRVTNYDNFDKDQQLVLDRITVLQNIKEVNKVDILFQINPERYIDNSSSLKKKNLSELAKTLLQKYHVSHDCLVRDEYLVKSGIDSIRIQIENNCNSSSHIITDFTNVNIKKICLKYTAINSEQVLLNVEPFAKACQELDDLIKCIRLQRCTEKPSLFMSFNAILVGAIGSGKTTLVEEFFKRNHCNVFEIKISSCLKQYPGETESELRKIFNAACDFEANFKTIEQIVILIEDIDLLAPKQSFSSSNNSESANYTRICAQLLSLIDGIFTSKSSIMCLATTSKPDNLNELIKRPGRFEREISIATFQEGHRCDILKRFLKQSLPYLDINNTILETMTKQTQGYVIADLVLLMRKIEQLVSTKSGKNLDEIIRHMLIKSKPISLKGSDVTAYKTTETFESIGGMLPLKKKFEISVIAGLKKEESFKKFGLSLPKGVLLYGPPGCAKTTIAKCLATEANMNFIATSGAEVYSPYVGSAEKFIMKIFQTARKNAPSLIFLDEIDSLVGRRSITGSSNSSDVQVRILSTLLTEMDGVIACTSQNSHIIVIAATNRPDMVDDALMRPGRFDKLIHVPAPDLLSRQSILEICKRKMPFSKSVDLDFLAVQTVNYSGADICNLCNEAALQAFQRDTNTEEIVMEDFSIVLKTSKPSLTQSQIDWYYKFEKKFL